MDEANPASDRYVDVSLRLLTIFVLVSLVACVGFLSYRWLEPRFNKPAPPAEAPAPAITSPAPAAETKPAPVDEVLMDPHKTFRCIEKGKITFSDRACDSGSVQMLPLAPAQPQPGGTAR